MAFAFYKELKEIIQTYTIDLPLKMGSISVDISRFTIKLIILAITHGLTQKLGDLTSKYKVEPKNAEDRKNGVKYLATEEERAAAVKVAASALVERWYAGEWNQDGSARGVSETEGYRFSIIFRYLGIGNKEQALRRKSGIDSLVREYAIKRSGNSSIKGKQLENAITAATIEIDSKVESMVAIYKVD